MFLYLSRAGRRAPPVLHHQPQRVGQRSTPHHLPDHFHQATLQVSRQPLAPEAPDPTLDPSAHAWRPREVWGWRGGGWRERVAEICFYALQMLVTASGARGGEGEGGGGTRSRSSSRISQ